MCNLEELLNNFVAEGTPFKDVPLIRDYIAGKNVNGNLIVCIYGIEDNVCYTLACKPAFSDIWLIADDAKNGEIENYIEALLHRALSKAGETFKYL